MSALLSEQCPRFNGCSANVCPLDPGWRLRKHLRGEAVCGLLLESVKPGGEARLRGALPAELVEQVLRLRVPICDHWGSIKRQLTRSTKTGSKLEAGQRLRSMS